MDPLTTTALAATATVAASSVLATIVSTVYSRVTRANKVREFKALQLEEILARGDLDALAKFLDETVGQFDVGEYVSSKMITITIDRYFDGVLQFLGTNSEVEEDESYRDVNVPLELGERINPLPDQLAEVISELEAGELWNALSRLRRILEINLREKAIELGFKERHLKSAGQILRILADRAYIAPNVAEALGYSIAICNRAVHGRDVTIDEARKAFLLAERWVDGLLA